MGRSLSKNTPSIGLKERAFTRRWLGASKLCSVGLLLAFLFASSYAAPAAAQEPASPVRLAFDLPNMLQLDATGGAKSFSGPVQAVSETVLAEQRGSGAAFAVPVMPASQTQPGIVLWDELKTSAQSQNISTPGGTAVNQINPIQIR